MARKLWPSKPPPAAAAMAESRADGRLRGGGAPPLAKHCAGQDIVCNLAVLENRFVKGCARLSRTSNARCAAVCRRTQLKILPYATRVSVAAMRLSSDPTSAWAETLQPRKTEVTQTLGAHSFGECPSNTPYCSLLVCTLAPLPCTACHWCKDRTFPEDLLRYPSMLVPQACVDKSALPHCVVQLPLLR